MRISDWSSDVCSSDLCRGDRCVGVIVGTGTIVVDIVAIGGLGRVHLDARLGRERGEPRVALGRVGRAQPEMFDRLDGFDQRQLVRRQLALIIGIAEAAFLRARERSDEPTSELQSLMRISYAVFCLKKKTTNMNTHTQYLIHS